MNEKTLWWALIIFAYGALIVLLAGCSSVPEKGITYEAADAFAPYIADARKELASAKGEMIGGSMSPTRASAVLHYLDRAALVLDDLQASTGPADPSGDCDEQRRDKLAKIKKSSRKAADDKQKQENADRQWGRDKDIFWYILIAGLIGTAACLLIKPLNHLIGFPVAGAAGGGLVLVFSATFRQIAGNVAGGVWTLIPVVLVVAVLAGGVLMFYLWYRKRHGTLSNLVTKLQTGRDSSPKFKTAMNGFVADLPKDDTNTIDKIRGKKS